MLDKALEKLASLCLRHSKQIAIVAAILAVAAIAAATRLRFDPDLLNLIPQNNKRVNDFRRVLDQTGTIDNHIVVMHMPKGHDVTDYDSLVEAIATGYKKSALVEDVNHRIPNPLDFVDIVLPRAFLLLSPKDLEQVAQKLSDEGIRESVERNRALLQTPQSIALKQLVQYDPFNLVPVYINKFKSASGGFNMDASSGYILSTDHEMLLILVKPKRPAQDVPFAKQLLAEGELIEARALKDFQKNAPPGTPLPRVEHSGGYAIALGDADLIRKDVIINVLGSFFGVLALFLYAFRRPLAILYAALTMGLGLALTFGTAGLAYGTLSSASAGFAALLAGLGIDFITIFYGRYVGERNRGATMAHGLIVAIRKSMPGILIGAITTAATFYAFLATEFRGMTELGSLTGTGILFFLLSVAFLLPALIVLSERHGRRKTPKLVQHSFGSTQLINASLRHPKSVIALWVVFVIICGAFSYRLRFSDNIQDLRAKGNIGVVNQEKVTKKFGQSFEFMMYVVEGRTLEEALQKTRKATHDLNPLVANHTVASYQSISNFLPPQDQQIQVISALQQGQPDRFNYDRINRTFRQALVANGFRPEAYDRYMELFRETLSPREPILLSNLGNADLLKLTERFVSRTKDGRWMSIIFVYPVGGRWPREVPPGLMDVAEKNGDVLTGVNLISSTLRHIVKADARRSTAVGLVAVALIMLISFRSAKLAALTFVPFLAGTVGMVGLMALFDLELNFMNIFVALMIISCGTDYAVYIIERYLEHAESFGETARETGKAVVMACLTTVVGYGSFALSHYPGLRSIGYASTFGIGLSGLAAITLLPAVLVLGGFNTNGQSTDDPAAAE